MTSALRRFFGGFPAAITAAAALCLTLAPQAKAFTAAFTPDPLRTQNFTTEQLDASGAEYIPSYDVSMRINADSSVDVSERIAYSFGSYAKHGIFRMIPVHYTNEKGNYNLRLSRVSVADENGNPYKFKQSSSGGSEVLKIGDPDKTITGKHVYIVQYRIQRAITYFSDHDELYWNAIGNEWTVPIVRASATVTLPLQVQGSKLQTACFTGVLGRGKACDSIQIGSQKSVNQITYEQNSPLLSEFFTIVVGMPKGIVQKPSWFQNLLDTVADNWVLAIPIAAFIVLFYIWRTRGRDPQVPDTVVAEYEAPDNLTPPEVGVIWDADASNRDISADIINLAVKGYIRIERTQTKILIFNQTDYIFHKFKQPGLDLAPFETALMSYLFGGGMESVALSSLKDTFYLNMKTLKGMVYSSCVDKGYFKKNPTKVRGGYITFGVVVLFLGFYLANALGGYAVVAMIITGLMIMIFGALMKERTVKGAETKVKIHGFKLYLSVAEKDRIQFHNAPEKNPQRFEKLLPYAMVLGVEKSWAAQFEGLYNQPPQWYVGAPGPFSTLLFVDSLNDFSNSANSVLVSQPGGAAGGGSGFGGGGFSGGGFGGGGGGSW